MKKFSNIDEKQKVLTEQKPKINKLVDFLVRENLQVTYNGDVDEAITKKLSVDGTDQLVEKLNQLIEKSKQEVETLLPESLKYNFGSQYDQKSLNQMISETAGNLYLNIIPLPHDIFSQEDYEQTYEDTIVLKSLNNIPSDFMDYINYNQASKYFENGNNVKMRYTNEGWELNFENNFNYGTTIDSNNDKYKKFLSENKDFVADFLRATTDLIGSQNILLDKNLVSQI